MGSELLATTVDFPESADKLCVLSDESFTAPLRLRRNNFGVEAVDPFTFPATIRRQIIARHPGAEMDVLLVLRNQADLLLSQFVEEFNLLTYKRVNILFNERDEIDLDGYSIYEFSNYIASLKETFGADRVAVLAFEEWIENPQKFYVKVAHAMRIPVDRVARHLGTVHLNRKEKRVDGYLTRNGTLIPFLNAAQKATIRSAFKASNLRLTEHGFDEETLARFGYL